MHDVGHATTQRPRRRRRDVDRHARGCARGSCSPARSSLWLVMDATVLQHNATVISPLGARRTAALDFLDPLVGPLQVDARARPAGVGGERGARSHRRRRLRHPDGADDDLDDARVRHDDDHEADPARTPTAQHPLRVLLVGDSIGEDLDGAAAQRPLADRVAKVFTDDHIATGLTRLDYFNWIAELEYDMYHDKPQVVIGMMGANDAQGFVDPPILYGTAAWKAKYERNVGQFFTIGKEYGAKMFWVSVPIISPLGRSEYMQLVRAIQERTAGKHHVFYIDSDKTLEPGRGVPRVPADQRTAHPGPGRATGSTSSRRAPRSWRTPSSSTSKRCSTSTCAKRRAPAGQRAGARR